MQVTLDRANDYFAGRFDIALYQLGLKQNHAGLHGARRDQHFGHEIFAAFKLVTYVA